MRRYPDVGRLGADSDQTDIPDPGVGFGQNNRKSGTGRCADRVPWCVYNLHQRRLEPEQPVLCVKVIWKTLN